MDVLTVERLLASSRPGGRLRRGSRWAILGLSILLGAIWMNPGLWPGRGPFAWLIPQCFLAAIVGVTVWHAGRQRRQRQSLLAAFEAVHLEDWPRAQAMLESLLRAPINSPPARTQALLALAAVAEAAHHDDATQRICESILEDGQGDPVQLHTARVALAAALLRSEQTADAVTLIDRLAPQDLPAPLRAQVELLALFREVVMGQAHTNINKADERRQLFRAQLGTRAGYGYALLATAFDRAGDAAQAGRFWHDATLLVPAHKIVDRFHELRGLADRYPAVEYPF